MKVGHIFNIMIGSPSDVLDIAKKAIDVINNWNILNSDDKGIVLIPHHWTSSSYPSLNNSAQKVLNSQLVEKSDALVAIFGSKLGTPTFDHPSGTAEEIAEHQKANKPVMVFFCKHVDTDVAGIEQLNKLYDYKKSIDGLYETFQDITEFEKIFSQKLNLFIQKEIQPIIETDNDIPQQQTVSFSDDELNIMRKWCSSSINVCSQIAFMGGNFIFRFGPVQIETQNPKDTAILKEFIKRLETAGFIESQKLDSHGRPIYALTLKAYEKFQED